MSVVQRAYTEYRQGNYAAARDLYRQASEMLGEELFKVNIELCEGHLQQRPAKGLGQPVQAPPALPGATAAQISKQGNSAPAAEQPPPAADALTPSPPILFQRHVASESKLTALYILDPISELSWSRQFNLIRLEKSSFAKQLESQAFDFLFLESCWKGNQGDWEFAFTSPELKHANAKLLLSAIDACKKTGKPVVFWNKEDPMHFERFLPIASRCDIVFTTDANLLDKYRQRLGHDRVGALEFAADPRLCNPKDRFRTPAETVCFAGAYYPEHHDERVRQMDFVLPAVLAHNGAIYDRYSEHPTDRYRFPQKYAEHIRKSVPFSEVIKVYKKFKVFLNVNTIIDSPTMMSRRVYELLASGTPVVSAPSKALETQFPDLVATGHDEAEIIAAVAALLNDDLQWERASHRGYREVMSHHTYYHRRLQLETLVCGKQRAVRLPLVSIVLASCRPKNLARMVENITRQAYPNCEVVYAVTPDFSAEDREALLRVTEANPNVHYAQLVTLSTETTLGRCLNEAIRLSRGDYIAKFDDDNFYFSNFLSDLMLPFSFEDYAIVGKESYYCYLGGKNQTILRFPEKRHRETQFVAGDAMIMKREIFEKTAFPERRVGEDSKLLKDVIALGGKIYSADRFNFIKYRAANLDEHTWRVEEEQLLRQSIAVSDGLNLEVAQC
jgi:spore maturation protein CgeB